MTENQHSVDEQVRKENNKKEIALTLAIRRALDDGCTSLIEVQRRIFDTTEQIVHIDEIKHCYYNNIAEFSDIDEEDWAIQYKNMTGGYPYSFEYKIISKLEDNS